MNSVWLVSGLLLVYCPIQTASGAQFQLESRYSHSPIEADSLTQATAYEGRPNEWTTAAFAARFVTTAWEVERIEYAGALSFFFWRGLSFNTRLIQRSIGPLDSGITDLMASVRLQTPLHWPIGAFVEAAWFERWIVLWGPQLAPIFINSSVRDHDFAARFGIHILPVRSLLITLCAGTIEEIAVYNFNNPYMEARTTYRAPGWDLFVFARYKILLGFGRLDELAAGIGVRLHSDNHPGIAPS